MRLLAAPDKFRGTATAAEIASAAAGAARTRGWQCIELPLADGGEGTLEALGGANRSLQVRGPLGDPVRAPWRLDGDLAVIEMARASGLALVGGAAGNDPIRADTTGTGELIAEAVRLGARRVILAVGGSATTDGGAGCVAVAAPILSGTGVEVVVACDVDARFHDAARLFGPQKGAGAREVVRLEARLRAVAEDYATRFGVDVGDVPGAGAAGGLAGGLLAVGAQLVSGFDVVAEHLGLRAEIGAADLVVTGEGLLDAQSLKGKVVGGVLDLCRSEGVRGVVIAGDVDGLVDVPAVSLVRRFGEDRARSEVLACVTEVVGDLLHRHWP